MKRFFVYTLVAIMSSLLLVSKATGSTGDYQVPFACSENDPFSTVRTSIEGTLSKSQGIYSFKNMKMMYVTGREAQRFQPIAVRTTAQKKDDVFLLTQSDLQGKIKSILHKNSELMPVRVQISLHGDFSFVMMEDSNGHVGKVSLSCRIYDGGF